MYKMNINCVILFFSGFIFGVGFCSFIDCLTEITIFFLRKNKKAKKHNNKEKNDV